MRNKQVARSGNLGNSLHCFRNGVVKTAVTISSVRTYNPHFLEIDLLETGHNFVSEMTKAADARVRNDDVRSSLNEGLSLLSRYQHHRPGLLDFRQPLDVFGATHR
jgi:hypothetical protein